MKMPLILQTYMRESMGTTVNLLIHHQFRTEKMAQQYLDISPKTYLFLNYCQLSINE